MTTKALKPRKTPVQARSAVMVRFILEAAARILERSGLDGYTTNAVAEMAGVSVGSLYQYFPCKDALTAALIERETALLLEDTAGIDALPDAAASLRSLIAACVAHQLRRPVLARLLDFEEQRLPLHDQQERMSESLIRTLIAILQNLPADIANPETAAADVLAMAKGIIDSAGERGETDTASLQERVSRAVFGYLGIPAEPATPPAAGHLG